MEVFSSLPGAPGGLQRLSPLMGDQITSLLSYGNWHEYFSEVKRGRAEGRLLRQAVHKHMQSSPITVWMMGPRGMA